MALEKKEKKKRILDLRLSYEQLSVFAAIIAAATQHTHKGDAEKKTYTSFFIQDKQYSLTADNGYHNKLAKCLIPVFLFLRRFKFLFVLFESVQDTVLTKCMHLQHSLLQLLQDQIHCSFLPESLE